MKRKPRKRNARALGFQVAQPTELQAHLFRAEATLDAMLQKLGECYAVNPERWGFVLYEKRADMYNTQALTLFQIALQEIRLAQSAASEKA